MLLRFLSKRKNQLGRFLILLMAALLIIFGVMSLLRGRPDYENYWGGSVSAPIAIAIGLFMIYCTIFHWEKL